MRVPLGWVLPVFVLLSPLPAQECRSDKVALVLAGGGAKGFAHIGVLRTLDSLGIRPDLVVGSSIGSIIGALYASGLSAAQIDSVTRSIPLLDVSGPFPNRAPHEWGSLLPLLLWEQGKGGFSLVTRGASEQRTNAVLNRILLRANLLAGGDFDQLPIPFRAVATDLRTREAVVLKSGDLAQAVRASTAIPLVYTPERIDGHYYIDGGISSNVPILAARNAGATRLIVVDLKDAGTISDSTDLSSPGAVARRLAGFLFTQPLAPLGPDDIYIWPDVRGVGNLDFQAGNQDQLVKNGRLAADSILAKISCLPRRPPVTIRSLPTHLRSWEVVNGTARDGETMGRVLGLARNQEIDLAALEAQLTDLPNTEDFREIWLAPVGGRDTVEFQARVIPAARRIAGIGLAYDHDLGGRLWIGGLDRHSVRGVEASALLTLGRFKSDLTGTVLSHLGVGRMSLMPLGSFRLLSEGIRAFTGNGENFEKLQVEEASAFIGAEWARLGSWRLRGGGVAATWNDPDGETHSTGGASLSARTEPGLPAQGTVELLWMGDYQLGRVEAATAFGKGRLSVEPRFRVATGRRLPIHAEFELGAQDGFPGLQVGERRGDREVYGGLQSSWHLKGPVSLRMLLAAGRSAEGGDLFDHSDWLAGIRLGAGATTPIGPVVFEYGFASNGRRAAFIRVGRWF